MTKRLEKLNEIEDLLLKKCCIPMDELDSESKIKFEELLDYLRMETVFVGKKFPIFLKSGISLADSLLLIRKEKTKIADRKTYISEEIEHLKVILR